MRVVCFCCTRTIIYRIRILYAMLYITPVPRQMHVILLYIRYMWDACCISFIIQLLLVECILYVISYVALLQLFVECMFIYVMLQPFFVGCMLYVMLYYNQYL